jgi:hypothetical protein
MYPYVPYFDIQVIEGQRDLGVGYIFLVLLKLYLKKENKVLEEDAYNTKTISLKSLPVGLLPSSAYALCFKVGYTRVHFIYTRPNSQHSQLL